MHQLTAECGPDDTEFTADDARATLRDMIQARRFDEHAFALQRRGWMSDCPLFRGQEASQIGAARAMRGDDVLLPMYRSNVLQPAHGVPPSDILPFRRGHAEYASGHDVLVFPQAVPIASQIPHTVGVGMAADYRGNDHTALVCFDDSVTSEGDFHERLNFTDVFGTSVVFFYENNGWAVSPSRERQTASESIVAKADAYGMNGIQVDGNDPLAVREATERGFEKTRAEEPVLIESLTCRQEPHTTADDPSRYRNDGSDLPEWRTRDPLDRFESFCREADIADGTALDTMRDDADEELREAAERAEAAPEPGTDELFDSVYKELPPELTRQREKHVTFVERTGLFDIKH